jgi:DNA helicase-2/ATP-dependent DNA helicase PcrA
VIAYIKCLINPQDSVSLKRVINIPNRKVGKTSIEALDEHSLLQNITLTETLQETQKANTTIKIAPLAKQGIKNFLDVIDFLRDNCKDKRPSEILEMLVKKVQYKDFLIKEEGSEAQAEEKYENIGQLINMAEKYIETGEDALRQFMEEVSLLADISENEK